MAHKLWVVNLTNAARHHHRFGLARRQPLCRRPVTHRATVELPFDPGDLTCLDRFWERRPVGQTVPFVVGRHVHRQVPQAQSLLSHHPRASMISAWS